jgi:hypothetical protein
MANKRRAVAPVLLLVGAALSEAEAAVPNRYQRIGEQLLDDLNVEFYDASRSLYVEDVDSSTLAKGHIAYLWPAAFMVRALTAGAMVDAKYDARLQSFIDALDFYVNGPGYGATHNGQRFFDDNGIKPGGRAANTTAVALLGPGVDDVAGGGGRRHLPNLGYEQRARGRRRLQLRQRRPLAVERRVAGRLHEIPHRRSRKWPIKDLSQGVQSYRRRNRRAD